MLPLTVISNGQDANLNLPVMEIWDRMKKARESAHYRNPAQGELSIRRAGDLIGVSHNTVSMWETAPGTLTDSGREKPHSSPRMEIRDTISQVYCVHKEWLFEGKGPMGLHEAPNMDLLEEIADAYDNYILEKKLDVMDTEREEDIRAIYNRCLSKPGSKPAKVVRLHHLGKKITSVPASL